MDFEVQVVNIHDFKGEHVYVGRGSPLGNPFSYKASKFEVTKVTSRSEAIEKYRAWLNEQLKYDTPQTRAINECMTKLISEKKIVLGCFCAPEPCHARVITEVLMAKVETMKSEWKGLFE